MDGKRGSVDERELGNQSSVRVLDRLNSPSLVDLKTTAGYLLTGSIPVAELPPLPACYLELKF